jgi:hypothetical protein
MPKAIVCRSQFGSLEPRLADAGEVDGEAGQEGEATLKQS